MKTVIRDVLLPDGGKEKFYVTIENKRISAIDKVCPTIVPGDDIIDGGGNLLISGFYNAHTHLAMTALRGYADDLPLHEWLFDHIFPAEDKLNGEIVYNSTMLAIAELVSGGCVACSDMYYFMDDIARAVIESGVKCNLARGFQSDNDTDPKNNVRLAETLDMIDKYNGYDDGRILTDFCIHAEYTNVDAPVRYIAELAAEKGLGIHVHVSETESEHRECIERHGKTPIGWLESLGVLNVPVSAAHCVWVSDDDIRIMSERKVSALHCPVSNMKLASGVMPIGKMLDAGVNVAIGTDGASSNNRLDMLRDLQFAALIHKGVNRDPLAVNAKTVYRLATRGGAIAQRRYDCGEIGVGYRADLVLLDMSGLSMIPSYDSYSTIAYSASSRDVTMTMVDGKVIYRNGDFKTIDIEKVKAEASRNIKELYML